MLTIKEAKKIPFEELDDETKQYIYDLLKKYIVRRQITETNKELVSLFAKKLKTSNPRDYAACFNEFNSAFVNAGSGLIRELDYDEIHTRYLRDMSEDRFNYYLNQRGNTFNRKIALICFSKRPSERIANRFEFPVMVAYANMQNLVLRTAEANPKMSLSQIFRDSATSVRSEFYREHGKKINDTTIAETRTDYKSIGIKLAPIWQNLFKFERERISQLSPGEAIREMRDKYIFTQKDREFYDYAIDRASVEAYLKMQEIRTAADAYAEEFPESYNLADYDEVFSSAFEDEMTMYVISDALFMIFTDYLQDPIYAPKEPKEKEKTGE